MSLTDDEAREARLRRQARGRDLRMIGVLLAALCGLCTATCAGPMAVSTVTGHDDGYGMMFLPIAGVIGVLPFIVGVVLAIVGHRMARTPEPKRADD